MASVSNTHAQLGPFKVPRVFNGLWQLSSEAWGVTDTTKVHGKVANRQVTVVIKKKHSEEMARYVENGFYAFGV